jgi:hypothetical protein
MNPITTAAMPRSTPPTMVKHNSSPTIAITKAAVPSPLRGAIAGGDGVAYGSGGGAG